LIEGVRPDGIEAKALGGAVLKSGDDASLHGDFAEVAEHFVELIARDFIVIGGKLSDIGSGVGLGSRGGKRRGRRGAWRVCVDILSIAVVDDDDSVALNNSNGSAFNLVSDGEA